MSYAVVESEREPLLSVSNYDISNSGDIHYTTQGVIDHSLRETETVCTPVTSGQLQVFKRRWYILILFSLIYVIQSTIWNTWGPLTQSARIAFGWSLDDIALLTNWGCIMYVCSMVFFSWLMDVKGGPTHIFDCDQYFLFLKNYFSVRTNL